MTQIILKDAIAERIIAQAHRKGFARNTLPCPYLKMF
jgi:hypothetical protein